LFREDRREEKGGALLPSSPELLLMNKRHGGGGGQFHFLSDWWRAESWRIVGSTERRGGAAHSPYIHRYDLRIRPAKATSSIGPTQIAPAVK